MRELVPAVRQKILSVTCDRCKKTFPTHDNPEVGNTTMDCFEADECVHISHSGGYGSETYGDMRSWSVDLCQYCVREVLGEWIVVDPDISWPNDGDLTDVSNERFEKAGFKVISGPEDRESDKLWKDNMTDVEVRKWAADRSVEDHK